MTINLEQIEKELDLITIALEHQSRLTVIILWTQAITAVWVLLSLVTR